MQGDIPKYRGLFPRVRDFFAVALCGDTKRMLLVV